VNGGLYENSISPKNRHQCWNAILLKKGFHKRSVIGRFPISELELVPFLSDCSGGSRVLTNNRAWWKISLLFDQEIRDPRSR
jgi:hypothetical protein